MRAFLALICTLGLACIGPAAAHAGGQKKQQQSGARPYAGQRPAYQNAVGGAYHFNVPNAPPNRSALTGIGTQRGVQVPRPNTNQPYQPYQPYRPYIRQLGTPTPTRTPLQVVRPDLKKQSYPQTAASAKTRNVPPVNPTPMPTPILPGRPPTPITTHIGAKTMSGATGTASTRIAPTEQFQQNRRIQGSDQWAGSNYQTFRNYRSEWHDRDWWRSHYSHIVFGAGGWYYWNAGYWFPAWGYDPEGHYAYDGPIYAYNDLPPDQVVANAQAALRPQGYYQAEADGLLGSHTRTAIVNYQRDHGLYETSTVDRPTSQSLRMK